MRTIWLTTAVIICCGTSNAIALPLTPFLSEAQARQYCPTDVVVWLDFRKQRYYFKHHRLYGEGRTGSYVCREEARGSGYRRSLLGYR